MDEVRINGEFSELSHLNTVLTQRCLTLAGELAAMKKAVEAAALINEELKKQLEKPDACI